MTRIQQIIKAYRYCLKQFLVPDKFQNQSAWFYNPYLYHKLLSAFKVASAFVFT